MTQYKCAKCHEVMLLTEPKNDNPRICSLCWGLMEEERAFDIRPSEKSFKIPEEDQEIIINTMELVNPEGKIIATMNRKGKVTLGEDVDPIEAGKFFWDAVVLPTYGIMKGNTS